MAGGSTAVSLPLHSVDDAVAAAPHVGLHLRRGGVIACPTETVYGLSSALTAEGLGALVQIKRRPPEQPFLVLVSGMAMLDELRLTISSAARELMMVFWPGPLTLILPAPTGDLPGLLRGPDGGVAVRWTSHRPLAALIETIGAPISSTSANRTGEQVATDPALIAAEFAEEISKGTLIVLDDGSPPTGSPSTIVDCVGVRPVLIRDGAIPAAMITATTGVSF